MFDIFCIKKNLAMRETVSFGVSLSCIFIYFFLSKKLAGTSGKVPLFQLFLYLIQVKLSWMIIINECTSMKATNGI